MDIIHKYSFLDKIYSSITMSYSYWRIGVLDEEKKSYNKTDKILLTFDDFTDQIRIDIFLEILKKENVKAAFFIVGEWAEKNPNIIKKIKNEGHWLGNHTRTHSNLLKISNELIQEEILGGPNSSMLRPPFGAYNNHIREIAKELGYKICLWDIDSEDWKGLSPEKIKIRILRSLHPGACVLMHLNGKNTLEVLPQIIKEIRDKNYVICNSKNDLNI